MITLVSLLALSLATWRISSLIVNEDGPWDLFIKFRHRAGVRYDELSQPVGTNMVSRALTCVWCSSVWVALGWMIFWLIDERIAFIASLPFALSAIAIVMERYIQGE